MTAVPKNLDDELSEVDEPPPVPPKCFSFDEELPPALPPQRMVASLEVSDVSLSTTRRPEMGHHHAHQNCLKGMD